MMKVCMVSGLVNPACSGAHTVVVVVPRSDAVIHQLFEGLKQLSRELLALVRLSSILPRANTISLSPIMARRVEVYISRKEVQDAASLADFISSIIDCTH